MAIERSVNDIIVDFVVVLSRSNSENLKFSMQNLFKVSKREGFQNGSLSEICSKIGLEIERSNTLSDRV